MTPDDLEQIRQVVREEIEASKPKVTLFEDPRTPAERFLSELDNGRSRRWWQR